MLFVLAWLLWLYHRNEQNGSQDVEKSEEYQQLSGSEEEKTKFVDGARKSAPHGYDSCLEEVVQSVTKEHSEKCLFIESKHHHDNGHIHSTPIQTGKRTVEEDIISQNEAVNSEYSFDDFDWDEDGPVFYRDDVTEDSQVGKAKILTQASIKREKVEKIGFSNGDVVLSEPTEIKTAKLFSQPSIKRNHGNIAPKSTAVQPMSSDMNNELVINPVTTVGSDLKNGHTMSLLNIDIKTTERERKLSESSITLKPPPVIVNFEVSDNELEDSEVADAFSEESEKDMKYITKNGTHVTLTNGPSAGRIHSIVVSQDTKPTKIRCSSPKVRAVSPRIHLETKSSSVIKVKQEEESNHSAHLVVRTNGSFSHDENEQSTIDEQIALPVTERFVETGNPSMNFESLDSSAHNDDNKKRRMRDPNFLEKESRNLTDFDTIMNRRKKYVDTMDNAGRLLGQIAHRDEKINGKNRPLSKHWMRLKDAVRKQEYRSFKDIL